MSLRSNQGLAGVARVPQKAIPARGSRRYAISGLAAALVVFGAVAAANAQPARAHSTPGKILSFAMPASPRLMGFQQGFVAISDSTIHYVIGGHGDVLVLLHGWPMTWWEWHTVMPSLAKHHTVVAFDLPGWATQQSLQAAGTPRPTPRDDCTRPSWRWASGASRSSRMTSG